MGIIPTQIKALSQHVLSPPGGAKPGFSRFPSHGGNLSSSRGGYGWHLAATGKPSSTGSTNLMTPVARDPLSHWQPGQRFVTAQPVSQAAQVPIHRFPSPSGKSLALFSEDVNRA